MCDLINEMLPTLQAICEKNGSDVPQIVVSLNDTTVLDELDPPLDPPPLVIGESMMLPPLVCEILHPSAHWTGSFGTNGTATVVAANLVEKCCTPNTQTRMHTERISDR